MMNEIRICVIVEENKTCSSSFSLFAFFKDLERAELKTKGETIREEKEDRD